MFAKRRDEPFLGKWMGHAVVLLEISSRLASFFDPTSDGVDVVVLGVTIKICRYSAFNSTVCRWYSLTFLSRSFLGSGRCTGSSFGFRFVILSKLFDLTSLSLSIWIGRSDRGWWIVRTLRLESAFIFVSGLEDVPLCQEWYLLVKEVEGVAHEPLVANEDVHSSIDVRSYERI